MNTLIQAPVLVPNAIWMCPWRQGDRRSIFNLLSFLPSLYPGASQWLDRRLDDVERGRAACTIGGFGNVVSGILIESPKGRRHTKISTFFVRSAVAGSGLGSKILGRHECEWSANGIDRAHITVAAERIGAIGGFLLMKGFVPTVRIADRYRHDSVETVFALDVH